MSLRSPLWLALPLAFLACTTEPDPGIPVTIFDAGNVNDQDSGGFDATYLDATPADVPDADPVDADPVDADPVDGGADAAADVGPEDAEVGDVAPLLDAGDGGPLDADDGGALDGGADAGIDGGPDAQVDAGPDAGYAPPPSGYVPTDIDTNFRFGQGVRLVDLDNNGQLDVLMASSFDDTIYLYLNNSGASSFTRVDIGALAGLVAMDEAIADFDGDGDLDVVGISLFNRAVPFQSPGDIIFYANPGSPQGFWTPTPIALSALYGMVRVESGDLTGDGRPDLVIGCDEAYDLNGNVAGFGVYLVPNSASGFGAISAIDPVLGGVEVVAIVDVDQDGVLDVVASSRNDSLLVWYENLRAPGTVVQTPSFTRHTIANLNLPSGFAIGQVDPDSGLELVVVQDDETGGRLWLYDSPVDPTMVWNPTLIDVGFGGSGMPIRVVLADLNRDGVNDLAISSGVHDQVRTYIRQPLGAWQMQLVSGLLGVTSIAVGDLDGDLYPDLVTGTFDFDPSFDRLTWWRTEP